MQELQEILEQVIDEHLPTGNAGLDQLNISGPCDVSQNRENMLNFSGQQSFVENRNNISEDAISNNSDRMV